MLTFNQHTGADRRLQPPAPVLDSSARQALVEEAAGKSTRQVERLLAGVDPELTAPADRIRPLGAGRWELKAVIDDECRRGLEQLKGLLSHVDPHMTLGQLVGRAVREAVERHDPARPPRGRRSSRAEASGADETSAPKDTPIPDAATAEPAQRKAAPTGRASSPAGSMRNHRRFGTEGGRPASRARAAASGTWPRHPGCSQAAGLGARDQGCCSLADGQPVRLRCLTRPGGRAILSAIGAGGLHRRS